MKKLSQKKWSQENKHDLRSLYSDFLKNTGVSQERFQSGNCASYSDFQDYMYKQTIHYI